MFFRDPLGELLVGPAGNPRSLYRRESMAQDHRWRVTHRAVGPNQKSLKLGLTFDGGFCNRDRQRSDHQHSGAARRRFVSPVSRLSKLVGAERRITPRGADFFYRVFMGARVEIMHPLNSLITHETKTF